MMDEHTHDKFVILENIVKPAQKGLQNISEIYLIHKRRYPHIGLI